MATIKNIKKRADEIKNAYEPESVTAEKVGQLFEDIADVTEQVITSSEEVMQESVRAATQAAQAAEDASGYLAELEDAIQDLPDGQAVSAQVAVNKADISTLKGKTSSISNAVDESGEEGIRFETDEGTLIGKINSQGADFLYLKQFGHQVATTDNIPTLDTSIGDSPSNSHTPSTKAVKDYVDANLPDIDHETASSEDKEIRFETDNGTLVGKVDADGADFVSLKKDGQEVATLEDVQNIPISEEVIHSDTEEFEFTNDAGSQSYAKIGNYGIKAKAYLDMNGNPIRGGDVSVQTISGRNYLVFS